MQGNPDSVRFIGELRERLLRGRTGVDHERFPGLARQRDLSGESALLVCARRTIAVEVQPGLPNRDAALMRGKRAQLGQIGVVEARGRVRMPAHGGIHLGERLGSGESRPAGGTVDAHGDHAPHAHRHGGGHQLRIGWLAQLQMGMGVYHAARASRGSLGKSGSIGLTRASLPAPSEAPASERSGAPSAFNRRSALAGT